MKKTYQQPDIGVEELRMKTLILVDSPATNKVTNVIGADLHYAGAGEGPARVGEYNAGEEGDDILVWDNL